jgi:hypothetical protein
MAAQGRGTSAARGHAFSRRSKHGTNLACEKSLEVDGDDGAAYNNLTWLLSEHGDAIDRALRLAQQAKEEDVRQLASYRHYRLDLLQ